MHTIEMALEQAADDIVGTPSFARAGARTVVATAALNALLYRAGVGGGTRLTLAGVVAATVAGVGAGVAGLAVLRHRSTRPFVLFRRLAVGLLLGWLVLLPLLVRGLPVRVLVALDALHAAALAVMLLTLPTGASRRRG